MEVCRQHAIDAVLFLLSQAALRRGGNVYLTPETLQQAASKVFPDLVRLDPHTTVEFVCEVSLLVFTDVVIYERVPQHAFMYSEAIRRRRWIKKRLPKRLRQCLLPRVEPFAAALLALPPTAPAQAAK